MIQVLLCHIRAKYFVLGRRLLNFSLRLGFYFRILCFKRTHPETKYHFGLLHHFQDLFSCSQPGNGFITLMFFSYCSSNIFFQLRFILKYLLIFIFLDNKVRFQLHVLLSYQVRLHNYLPSHHNLQYQIRGAWQPFSMELQHETNRRYHKITILLQIKGCCDLHRQM